MSEVIPPRQIVIGLKRLMTECIYKKELVVHDTRTLEENEPNTTTPTPTAKAGPSRVSFATSKLVEIEASRKREVRAAT